MKFKKILHTTLNEGNVNEGERWFIENTNLEKKEGSDRAYIRVQFRNNLKEETKKILSSFLKTKEIDFFSANHKFTVDLSNKYDAILKEGNVINKKNSLEKFIMPSKDAPGDFYRIELKNYSGVKGAYGKYVFQSSRVANYPTAYSITKNLLPEVKEKITLEKLMSKNEQEKKEERKKFLELIASKKEEINSRIARSSRHGEFFNWLANKLNKIKDDWIIPKNYFFLFANHNEANKPNNFANSIKNGIRSFKEIKENLVFIAKDNTRIPPFRHIELILEPRQSSNNSTDNNENMINEIKSLAGDDINIKQEPEIYFPDTEEIIIYFNFELLFEDDFLDFISLEEK
jgi:hypothetical protein